MTDETKLPDAGHIYTGPTWRRAEFVPAPGLCRHAVHEGGRGCGFHQCNRAIKVERDVIRNGKPARFGYCAQHDPIAVADRRAKRKAKWDADWKAAREKQEAAERERRLRDAALEAIRKIAAGHNDPRGLAIEVLEGKVERSA